MRKEKVVVGMSGGVDSSVAAYILKKAGYDVIGVTMQIWQDESPQALEDHAGCCGLSAVEDARRVAYAIDIPYYVLNFKDIFNEAVIKYFSSEYLRGRTPNPCIACNRYVKWESLLNKALQLDASYIATGHYAQICKYPKTGRYTLKVSKHINKDQTYALYNLSQFQLSHTLMPLWQYEKGEVRQIASDIGLCIANKPDSQEICFIPDNDYGSFVKQYTNAVIPPGNFVDLDRNILAPHKGIIHYTVGQRKGLGVTFGKPMYVKSIDPVTQEIILAEDKDLYSDKLYVENVNFMAIDSLEDTMKVQGKIRYSHSAADCTIKMNSGYLECTFDQPQRALTPGQAAVFYQDDYLICGGSIVGSELPA